MRNIFNTFQRRNAHFKFMSPHLRRDIGLFETDRSDWLLGRELGNVRGWL